MIIKYVYIIQMQYNNFIQSSLALIKSSRQHILGCNVVTKFAKIPHEPQNAYLEVLAQKNSKLYKMQQWNFKCLKTLVESEYQSNQDSQLDSVQLEHKSYFSILEQTLQKFSPKLLIKTLEPTKIIMSFIRNQSQLRKFEQENLILINIYDYEGQQFNCHVSLQTIHSEFNRSEINRNLNKEIGLFSSQQEFQVLVDSEYEREKKQIERQKLLAEEMQRQKQKQITKNQNDKSNLIVSRINQQISQQQNRMIQSNKNRMKVQKSQIQSIQKMIDKKQQKKIERQDILFYKQSTKQFILSDYQRKISLVTQTIDLIQQAKPNIGSVDLKSFLKKLE